MLAFWCFPLHFSQTTPLVAPAVQMTINQEAPDHMLEVTWKHGQHKAVLHADLQDTCFHYSSTVESDDGRMRTRRFILDNDLDLSEPTKHRAHAKQSPAKRQMAFADA